MNNKISWRVKFLLLIIAMLFSVLIYNLFNLMIGQHNFLEQQGNRRSNRVELDYASRGIIYDRNKKILAQSMPSAHVRFNKNNLPEFNKHKQEIIRILQLNKNKLHEDLISPKHQITLKRWLSPDEISQLEQAKFNFLQIQKMEKRYYPWNYTTAPLLGNVNVNGIGSAGVEQAYDELLQSTQGKFLVEKNRRGEVVSIKNTIVNAKESNGLTLTIDADVQTMVYNTLVAGLEEFGAKSGSAIVINPSTGEIIAMANAPSFNSNNSSKINISNMRNRALMDLFEPGSTIKPFTIAVALDSGQYNANSEIDTVNGKFNLFGHEIQDETHMHGLLSLTNVLKKSSNVAIAKIGLSLDTKLLPSLLVKMGFDRPVLGFPGEAIGHINHRAWQHKVEQASLAFGYGMNTTALQLAHAYTIIANNGIDKGLYLTMPHAKSSVRILSEPTVQTVREMLKHVVEPGGTAAKARIADTIVAGKTSTTRIAENGGYKKRAYIATFVGMFPADKPDWVVLVVVNKPNLRYYFGGRSAAPIFSRIGENLLRMKKLDRKLDPTFGKI